MSAEKIKRMNKEKGCVASSSWCMLTKYFHRPKEREGVAKCVCVIFIVIYDRWKGAWIVCKFLASKTTLFVWIWKWTKNGVYYGGKGEPYVCLTMGPNKVIIRSGYWLYFTIKSDSIFQKRSKLSRIYDFRTQFHCRCRCRQPKWIFRSKRTPFPIPNRNVCLLPAQTRFIRKM